MRRPLRALALSLILVPAGSAQAATGRFFPASVVDETAVDRLEDVDLAHDGTGAIGYLRVEGGEPHAFVARIINGVPQAPERVDVGIPGAATGIDVAASNGGRVVAAFTTGGGAYAAVRANPQTGFAPPQPLGGAASEPSASMSILGTAYITFKSGGDVRAARMERTSTSFALLPEVVDVDPGHDVGRARVVTSADGSGLAVFEEAGLVVARRLYGMSVSRAPQLLGEGDQPDVGIEDDSSFAWAVWRDRGGRIQARRQRGSAFDDAVVVDAGGGGAVPRIALSGRGDGLVGANPVGVVTGSVIKDDKANPGLTLGPADARGGNPVAAISELGDGILAWFGPDGGVRAREYDNVPTSRVVHQPGPEAPLTDAALGVADPTRGLEASSNRVGDVLVAFVQTDASGTRRLVAGAFDRAPGAFQATTTGRWRRFSRPPLRWQESLDLWGPLTYRVEVDGQPVATTQATALTVPIPIADGRHTWRVVAIDRRGQETPTQTRSLRVDATGPRAIVTARRIRGGRVNVRVRPTDANPAGAGASGMALVRIKVGRTRAVTLKKPPYRIIRPLRSGTVRVTAADRAGNVTVVRKRVTG